MTSALSGDAGPVPTARRLAAHGELVLTDELVAQLGRISIASIQRRLTRWGRTPPACRARGQSGPTGWPGDPDAADPLGHGRAGHFEVDLVHHSGPSTHGDYVHTLQLVDVATGLERAGGGARAQPAGDGARLPPGARAAALPDPRAAPDNGPEFLNAHLVRFWGAAITGLTLSRSRPYHKNDNRLVEQKNDTLVRAYVGHGRLDTPQQCAALNALYEQMWSYYNLFQPALHLVEKTPDKTRVRRRWDAPSRPSTASRGPMPCRAEQRARLAALRNATNPRGPPPGDPRRPRRAAAAPTGPSLGPGLPRPRWRLSGEDPALPTGSAYEAVDNAYRVAAQLHRPDDGDDDPNQPPNTPS